MKQPTIKTILTISIITFIIQSKTIPSIAASTQSSSSSSSSNYNVYNYDYTTPIFTPDGLLKQVEYASLASTHSSPLVVIPLIITSKKRGRRRKSTVSNDAQTIDDNDEDDDNSGDISSSKCYILMATTTATATALTSSTMSLSNEEIQNLSNEKNKSSNQTRGQNKIISIPISPPQQQKHHHHHPTKSSSILIGINGLLPDCMYLLRHARDELHTYHKTFGIHRIHTSRDGIQGEESLSSSPTSSSSSSYSYSYSSSMFASATSCSFRFAKSIADKCQTHSFGGGLRPFGSHIIICGVDERTMSVYITDPSGAVRHYGYDVVSHDVNHDCRNDNDIDNDDNNDNIKEDLDLVQDVIVIGGKERIQRTIRNDILQQCHGWKDGSQLKDVIKVVYECLLKNVEQHDNGNDNNNSRREDDEDKIMNSDTDVEVVLLGYDNCQSISNKQLKDIILSSKKV